MSIPPSPNASWRDTARPPRLAVINANAIFPILLWLLHIQWWTFVFAASTIIFLTAIEWYGFSLPVFGRYIRAFIAGKRKQATPWWL